MADNVESLVLEHLKRFQATIDRMEHKYGEITNRLSNLESGQASISQHLGHLSSADATAQIAIDRINERLDRIERRLELAS